MKLKSFREPELGLSRLRLAALPQTLYSLLNAGPKWFLSNWSPHQRQERNLLPGSIQCDQFNDFLVKVTYMLRYVSTCKQLATMSDISLRNYIHFWWNIVALIIFQNSVSMSWFPASHLFFFCMTSVGGLLLSKLFSS